MQARTMNSKLIYFFYYVVGGFYATQDLSKKVKRVILWCYITWFFIFNVVGMLGYIVTAREISTYDIAIFCGMIDSSLNIGLILVTTHSYHKEFQSLLFYIVDTSSAGQVTDNDDSATLYIEKRNVLKEATFWIITTLCGNLPYLVISFVELAFLSSGKSFQNLKHHVYPYLFENSVPTVNVAISLFMIEFVIYIFGTSVASSQPIFIMVVSTELNNIVVNYCKEIKNMATFIEAQVNSTNGWKMSPMGNHMLEQDFASLVRKYKKFVKMVDMMRPYVEFFNTLGMIFVFVALLVFSYTALLADLETFVKLKQLSLSMLFTIFFYAQCVFGHKFNNMNEAICYEVYSLPWYSLPPKQRKLVYIFLTEVQHPIEFKAFNVYPINLQTFPSVLKAAYSYVSVLRRTINFSGHNS